MNLPQDLSAEWKVYDELSLKNCIFMLINFFDFMINEIFTEKQRKRKEREREILLVWNFK